MPTESIAQTVRTPSYRRQKRQGRADIAFVQIDGRRHYLGDFDDPATKERYHRLLAENAAGAARVDALPAEVTIVELCAAFIDYAQKHYTSDADTPSKEVAHFVRVIRPLKELYGSLPVAQFGPKALKAVRQRMIDQGWCRKHVNKSVQRLRQIFRWGVEEEIIPGDSLHRLAAVRGLERGRTDARESEPVRPVALPHVYAIESHTSRVVFSMVMVQLLSGARGGEVCIMRAKDIDTSGRVWIYRPQQHKGAHRGQSREIYLTAKAQEFIRPFMRADRPLDAVLFSPRESFAELKAKGATTRRRENQKPNEVSGVIHVRNQFMPGPARVVKKVRTIGERFNIGSYAQAITSACRKAGVPRFTPHQLRHTAGTLIRAQFGLDGAQVWLGHKEANVTQVYAEVDRRRALQIAEGADALMNVG